MRTMVITAACLALLASTSAQQKKPTNSAMPSGKAVLEAYVSAWNRHDFAALDQLLTPDAVHEDLAQGVHAQGIAQIKDFMREEIKIAPDLDWRLTKVVDAGPTVAAEWTWSNTFTGDGPTGPVKDIRISGRGTSVVVTENGRIKRFSDYYDFASFFPKEPAVTNATAQQHTSAEAGLAHLLELKTHQAWNDYKIRDKADLAPMLADDLRIIEEGDTTFRDKKSDIDEVDTLKLREFNLTNFTVIPTGNDGALVTYFAEFTAAPSGQEVHGKAVYGEVWLKRGGEWEAVYVQGTPVK